MNYFKKSYLRIMFMMVLFLIGMQLRADESGLLGVPDSLPSEQKTKLAAERTSLMAQYQAFENAVKKYNDEKADDQTDAEANQVMTLKKNYIAAAKAFNDEVLQATKIGVAAAVRGEVDQLTADSRSRVVHSSDSIFSNAHITTSPDGRLQVLLLDETIFTLGPSSDMIMDDFVYDPKTSAGKISARIAKGTFRFVTGKIAPKDPDKMKIKVAVGTIGVRGTDVEVSVEPGGDGYVRLFSGKLEITETKSGSVFDMDAGQMVKFHGDGSWDQPTSLGAIKPTI